MASTNTNSNYKELELDSSGGTHTVNLEENFDLFRIVGAAVTMSSSWTITASNMGIGSKLTLVSVATLDLNGNTLTILGKSIPQSMANQPFVVIGVYNGSSWDCNILASFTGFPFITTDMIELLGITTALINTDAVTTAKVLDANITAAKLASDSVITAKILDDNVTLEKLEPDLLVETLVIPVSFETGEQCNNDFIIDYACNIVNVSACVTKAIAATDSATITLEIAGNPSTPSVITFAASDPLNTVEAIVPASNNDVAAGDTISLITAKTTVGGKALVSIKLVRT